MTVPYERSVFINCPFDVAYKTLFDAIIFTVHDCGFFARHALEDTGGREQRLNKIFRLIETSRLSIHDVSRVELDEKSRLPRFNMPFECGLAFGAMHFDKNRSDGKRDALVMTGVPYQDKSTISDLAGIDPCYHHNETNKVIASVRKFLAAKAALDTPSLAMRGHQSIYKRLNTFQAELPVTLAAAQLTQIEINSLDYLNDWQKLAALWIAANHT
ncbi:MAG: hypothetical protein RLZZ502_542 [Pseudomonadota bacterium]|jgi:hypothetical protein